MSFLISIQHHPQKLKDEISIPRGEVVEILEDLEVFFKVKNSVGDIGIIPKEVFSTVLEPNSNKKVHNIDKFISNIQTRWRIKTNRKSKA